MIQLPELFVKRMQELLGEEEYALFAQSYESERHQALRVNTAKISIEDFLSLSPFSLRQVPWAAEGFYYEGTDRPGKHPYHEAGLYYIQEPSAMAVAALADAQPGERVLDLCAAPGGKTTQLAAAMKGEGLLVSNEIHPARAKILAQNVERMGIPNALVTNESPASLVSHFPVFFDRIVVDAPCSGEGMFRKEEQAASQWSPENVELCARRQAEILKDAAKMLRPGGRLVYSTCTFAPEENEGSISCFLESHPEFSVEAVSAYEGFAPGRPGWAGACEQVGGTYRLWPHRLEGEGHYAAVLKKTGQNETGAPAEKETKNAGKGLDKKLWKAYEDFVKENLTREPKGEPVLFGEQLYLMPEAVPLKGLKVLRAGLHLGTFCKNRFEPSHALALTLSAADAVRSITLPADSPKVRAYLRGETLPLEEEKGWCLVLVDGYSLGWGKASAGVLKNHYPRGLRWNG